MSPPHVPGVPGTRLPPPKPPREESPSLVEAAEFNRDVHANYGKASFKGPAWAFLVGLLLLSCGAIVYLATRKQETATPTQCLTKDQFDASMRERDERVSRRFDTLETDTSYLKVALRLVQDRLPPTK